MANIRPNDESVGRALPTPTIATACNSCREQRKNTVSYQETTARSIAGNLGGGNSIGGMGQLVLSRNLNAGDSLSMVVSQTNAGMTAVDFYSNYVNSGYTDQGFGNAGDSGMMNASALGVAGGFLLDHFAGRATDSFIESLTKQNDKINMIPGLLSDARTIDRVAHEAGANVGIQDVVKIQGIFTSAGVGDIDGINNIIMSAKLSTADLIKELKRINAIDVTNDDGKKKREEAMKAITNGGSTYALEQMLANLDMAKTYLTHSSSMFSNNVAMLEYELAVKNAVKADNERQHIVREATMEQIFWLSELKLLPDYLKALSIYGGAQTNIIRHVDEKSPTIMSSQAKNWADTNNPKGDHALLNLYTSRILEAGEKLLIAFGFTKGTTLRQEQQARTDKHAQRVENMKF